MTKWQIETQKERSEDTLIRAVKAPQNKEYRKENFVWASQPNQSDFESSKMKKN